MTRAPIAYDDGNAPTRRFEDHGFRMPAYSVTETPRWLVAIYWIAIAVLFSVAAAAYRCL